MSNLQQFRAVTVMNLRSVPQRLGSSSVVVVGIAGVVGVLVSILAMVNGLTQTVASTGRDDRAIVLSVGSNFEFLSSLSHAATASIADAPGIRRGTDGRPVASAESLIAVQLPLRDGGHLANLSLRGVGSAAFAIRPQLQLVQGRMFGPAVRELIVGRAAQRQFRGLEVGSRIMLRGVDWTVVGVYSSEGDQHETGMLTGVETLQSAFQRNNFQSVSVWLDSKESFADFKAALTRDPALSVDVVLESAYYAQQSRDFSSMLSVVAYLVGGIMAIGAVFGALNTMYSAVSTRTVEIATLRVLGFGAGTVVLSVFVEALLLATLGGMLGGGATWLLFNGHVIATSGGGFTQLAVPLAVNPGLIGLGILWACVIGMLGASFPAIRASRAPLAAALRGV